MRVNLWFIITIFCNVVFLSLLITQTVITTNRFIEIVSNQHDIIVNEGIIIDKLTQNINIGNKMLDLWKQHVESK